MKPAFWIWMLFWSVFTGAACTALLVLLPQPTSMHFLGASVLCAVVSVPFSLSAGKALSAQV
jgi:uncharacterized membrane protein YhaH (DUF805 family)